MNTATAPSFDLEAARRHVRRLLQEGNLRETLRYVNSLTPHRFTGLYLFDDPVAHNKLVVDKLHPDVVSLPDVPVTATYCAFARATKKRVRIDDSLLDERAATHPARNEVRSYCGVPLVDEADVVFGTVCHFDYDVVSISDESVSLLESMAPQLRTLVTMDSDGD